MAFVRGWVIPIDCFNAAFHLVCELFRLRHVALIHFVKCYDAEFIVVGVFFKQVSAEFRLQFN